MHFSASFAFSAMVALASATYTNGTNTNTKTHQCPTTGVAAYCGGGDKIMRCNNGTAIASSCNDILARKAPIGLSGASFCYETSPTAGDAACSKANIVYPGSGARNTTAPFPIPRNLTVPYNTTLLSTAGPVAADAKATLTVTETIAATTIIVTQCGASDKSTSTSHHKFFFHNATAAAEYPKPTAPAPAPAPAHNATDCSDAVNEIADGQIQAPIACNATTPDAANTWTSSWSTGTAKPTSVTAIIVPSSSAAPSATANANFVITSASATASSGIVAPSSSPLYTGAATRAHGSALLGLVGLIAYAVL